MDRCCVEHGWGVEYLQGSATRGYRTRETKIERETEREVERGGARERGRQRKGEGEKREKGERTEKVCARVCACWEAEGSRQHRSCSGMLGITKHMACEGHRTQDTPRVLGTLVRGHRALSGPCPLGCVARFNARKWSHLPDALQVDLVLADTVQCQLGHLQDRTRACVCVTR